MVGWFIKAGWEDNLNILLKSFYLNLKYTTTIFILKIPNFIFMKKFLLSLGCVGVTAAMMASNGATRADAYSIDDVVGYYSGTIMFEGEEDWEYNDINVIIEKGSEENSLIIQNLFTPLFNFPLKATYNPEDNTIQVYEQYFSSEYYLYLTDEEDYIEEDGYIVLTIEDNMVYSGADYFDIYNLDTDVDYWYYGLDLEKTGDLESGDVYDINDVLGTYTVTAVDWTEDTDEYNKVILNDVVIELGNGENALVIKNLLTPVTNGSIKGTFNPEDNTIMIEEQWVDSNYYIYLYDPEDWLDDIYLTVNEDGTISSGDFAINAYAYYNEELPELYRGEMVFTRGSDTDTDSVNTLRPESQDGQEVIYNLQGVHVSKDRLTKGIYIINGKKVMVK